MSVQLNGVIETLTDINEGALISRISSYPYEARMRQLVMLSAQTNISVRSNDASANFQTLATEIGVLLAARNMDVKSSIASIIRAGMPDEAQTTPHPLGPPLNLPARDSAEINSNGGHDDVLELPRKDLISRI